MNATITHETSDPISDRLENDATSTGSEAGSTSLDSIVQAVCLDANYDSLKFVLRSDTGHDGE